MSPSREGDFFVVLKNSATIGKEHIGNPVIIEDLMQDMVITIRCLLAIEISADDGVCRIINSDMELGFFISEPVMKGSVHLQHFPQRKHNGDGGDGHVVSGMEAVIAAVSFLEDADFFIVSNCFFRFFLVIRQALGERMNADASTDRTTLIET